jgi:superfamily I DNA/RNA helicase
MPEPPPDAWTRGLNSQQAAAVLSDPDGAALVLAGAGSGKTTVLTRRVAYLLERYPESGILALTFTKDAASEMRSRLRERLGEDSGIPLPAISTFHAFAYGLIREGFRGKANWERLGFASCPSLFEADQAMAWLKAMKAGFALEAPLELLEDWIRNPFAPDPVPRGPEEAPAAESRSILRTRFRDHLLQSGFIAFDDMVGLALGLLREHPDLLEDMRRRYRRILVDEFQDTSRDQLELVSLLAGEAPSLFLVGDDDQAIYGFRGADPGNIDAALSCFPGMRILKLETNYRSSAPIVAYANAVFRDKPEALRKRLEAGSDRGTAPVRTVIHRDGAEQACWMIAEMRRLHEREGLAWEDMAILFRLNVLEPYYRSMLARLGGEEAARGVVLATVHASKGLEYPAVFFAGLEDGILPYHRGKEPPAPERLAEERRIFYVGVTRAQRFLYLCSCRRRFLRGKAVEAEASPFLRGGRERTRGRWFRARTLSAGAAEAGKAIAGKAKAWMGAYRARIGRKGSAWSSG